MRKILPATAALMGMVVAVHAQPISGQLPAPTSGATYTMNHYERFSIGCTTIDGYERVNLNDFANRLPEPAGKEFHGYLAERGCIFVWRTTEGGSPEFYHIRTEGRFSLMRNVTGKMPDLWLPTSDFQGDLLNSDFVKGKRR